MVDRIKPEGCWERAVYLDYEEYMGMQTVYFNDGKAEELAKQCAEYLSDDNVQYQASRTKVACTSDIKFGNVWGWRVEKVLHGDEPPADCDTGVSYFLYDNAKKCADYLEKMGKGLHTITTLSENIGDGFKPVMTSTYRVDKAEESK
jgi:hypothetical protein